MSSILLLSYNWSSGPILVFITICQNDPKMLHAGSKSNLWMTSIEVFWAIIALNLQNNNELSVTSAPNDTTLQN